MGSVFKRRGAKRGSPWLFKYRGADGKWHTETGFVDREATETKMRAKEKQQSRILMGIHDPTDEHLAAPLVDHVDRYAKFLEGKEDTAGQVRQIKNRIKHIAKECGFNILADIDGVKVSEHLKARRDAGEITGRTSNAYLQAIKGFCDWLVDHRRMPHNPLKTLKAVRINDDDVRDRRAATDDEVVKLLAAARSGAGTMRLTGELRYWLYRVVLATGFRAHEASTLSTSSFCLSGAEPVVVLEQSAEKARRGVRQPIRPEEAREFAEWLATMPDDRPLWPGAWWKRAADLLAFDLEKAEVPVVVGGEHLDFHALRHTFVTKLVRAGVRPKEVQILARHRDIRLTMDFYTHLPVGDLYAALEAAHQGSHHIAHQASDRL
jgi:integrase